MAKTADEKRLDGIAAGMKDARKLGGVGPADIDRTSHIMGNPLELKPK